MTNISRLIGLLEDNHSLKISPEGTSMCPCFLGGRDTVYVKRPVFPLQKGDIALYLRDTGIYVIHRIYRVKQENGRNLYYMLGDNQTWIEGPLSEDQIHGVATTIIRKNKTIDCKTNLLYRFYVWLWRLLRPIRPLFMHVFLKYKSFTRK